MPTGPSQQDIAQNRLPKVGRVTAAFLICACAGRMANVGLPIGLVVQSVAHHHSSISAANAIALFGLVGALSGPLIGQSNDRSHHLLLRYRLSLVGFVIANLVMCRQSDVSNATTLVAAALSGIAAPMMGSSWSGGAARLVGLRPNPRFRAYDVSTYAFAAIASPLTVGVLGPLGGPATPLITCAGFAGVAAGTSLYLRTVPRDASGIKEAPRPRSVLPPWRTLVANWPFIALLLVTMGMQPIAVAATLASPALSSRLFGTPHAAGLILAILSVGTLTASLGANPRLSRHLTSRSICLMVVLTSLALPTARPGWLGVPCLLAIGIGNGLLLVETFAHVDKVFGVKRHSEIFAFAETSRMIAAATAAWLLGRVSLSVTGSMLLSVVPMAILLLLPLSSKAREPRPRWRPRGIPAQADRSEEK